MRASAILSGGRLLIRSLDLIAALVIARFLSPADFGLVTLATATLMVLRALTEMPVNDALIRAEELKREEIDTAFTLSWIRGAFVTLLLCAVAWPMAAIYDDERLVGLVLAMSVAPLVHGFRSPELVRFSREVNYGPDMALDAVAKLAAFALSIAVAVSTGSYWALVIALVAPPLVSTPLSYLFAPYRMRFGLAGTAAILGFAGQVTIIRFLSTASAESSRFFIGGILGTAALGFFALGRSIAFTVTWAIGMPLIIAMFPGFSRMQHDREVMRAAYFKGQAMLVAGIMPLGFGLAMLAEPVVQLVLGPTWLPVVPIVQVLAPAGALATMTMPVHAVALALGKPQLLLVRELLVFALGIPAVVASAYWFGLMGAVLTEMAVGVCQVLLNLGIVRRELNATIRRQLLNCWRSAASLACMVLVMFAIMQAWGSPATEWARVPYLAVQTAAGGLTYLAAHAALWLLAGKPRGAESLVLEMAAPILQRLTGMRRQESSA